MVPSIPLSPRSPGFFAPALFTWSHLSFAPTFRSIGLPSSPTNTETVGWLLSTLNLVPLLVTPVMPGFSPLSLPLLMTPKPCFGSLPTTCPCSALNCPAINWRPRSFSVSVAVANLGGTVLLVGSLNLNVPVPLLALACMLLAFSS